MIDENLLTFSIDDIEFHNKEIRKIIKTLPTLNLVTGPWIGGGAARRLLTGEKFSADIDIFFGDNNQEDKFRTKFLKRWRSALTKNPYETRYSSTYFVNMGKSIEHDEPIMIQIIKRRYYNSIEHIIDDFDFPVARIYTDGDNIILTQEALDDLSTQTLRLSGTSWHIKNSLKRLIKYSAHGYTPVPGMVAEIIQHKNQQVGNWVDLYE